MRRIFGSALIGLGVFGLALALLLPTVVVSGSKKTPLDLNITQISSGPAKLLDPTTQQQRDVTLRATRIVRSDSHASDGSRTTVNESLCTVIVEGNTPNCMPSSDPRLLSVTTDRVTTNRKDAESVYVAKYGENVNGDTAVRHTGLAYKWPIDAKKQTYQFFSPDLGKSFPAVYKGTSKIRGLTVYQFVCETGTQPYQVQGLFEGTYTDTRTVWVEPKTGAIINGTEHQVQTLASGQVVLDTTLSFEKSAVDYQSNFAKKKIRDLEMAQLWGPIGFGVLGLAALAGGLLLLLRAPRPATGGDSGGHRRDTPPPDDWQPSYSDEPFPFAGSSQT